MHYLTVMLLTHHQSRATNLPGGTSNAPSHNGAIDTFLMLQNGLFSLYSNALPSDNATDSKPSH